MECSIIELMESRKLNFAKNRMPSSFFLKIWIQVSFSKKNCIETVPSRGCLELCKMKKSSCSWGSSDDDDDDMFLYVTTTEKLACQSRRMAREQDTAENCFSGKFDNEVQIFLPETSKKQIS